ncbi:proteasome component (PCI) domain protein [Artemisia annua]|uniref:COP9 signalosome complex subunit 3 n=1 Tax=Artemisia annua TaxID=35608 RepID=A0A2U1M8H7_ARTAN|nr:proteasome component (PCI) domain protein [Artemisia annua]
MNNNNNNSSVESLVNEIIRLTGAGSINQLHNVLKQSEDVIRSQSALYVNCLSRIDPQIHSLGFLYVLEACTAAPVPEAQANELVLLFVRFIDVCNEEQIRLAPNKFIAICKRLHEQVMALGAPMRAVAPLRTAIRKIQVSPERLTALHSDFLQVCLSAKCYKIGYSVLENDIYEVDQPRNFFLYCYYGGMICIGQKRFAKALELFHNVVTAPMSTLNAIAVEAYKKYILVSLIHLRQFSASFPKYTSPAAQRNLKSFVTPYIELANSYSTGNITELQVFVQANQQKFESENNLGLVKQVVSSMYKRNIQRLTQTYLTLSLEDIANTAQITTPKEAEMHVLQMIEDGEIYATINQKDGMVRFLEDPEQYKTCGMIENIDSSIERIMKLSKKLTKMDEKMSCDPVYLSRVGKERRQQFDFDDLDHVPQKFNL